MLNTYYLRGHTAKVRKERLETLVRQGMDPQQFYEFTSYDSVLFHNGNPFMGDPMDPIIANNVRSEIIVAVDTF